MITIIMFQICKFDLGHFGHTLIYGTQRQKMLARGLETL